MKLPTLVARHRFSCSPRNLLRAFLLLLSPFSMLALQAKVEPQTAPGESINLPKLSVKGNPVCSFGIGVVCTRDPSTRKIQRVFISEVLPGSLADEEGLKEGDEILSLNGRKVAGGDGDSKRGAWLFDLLVDRKPGETIDVEVAVRVVKKLTLRAIRPAEAMPQN